MLNRRKPMAQKRRASRKRARAAASGGDGSAGKKRPAASRSTGAPPPPATEPTSPPFEETEGTQPKFPIVGLGASAGGLEACTQLLSGLTEELGMALVLVQHLAPQHHSILPDLLQSNSRMPVVQATHGIEVQPDHVYVIPPNVHLRIGEGRLWHMPRPEDRSQYTPIDYFFRTLADYAGAKAIGVILSGTASDGAAGLREIKAVGGISIAQDPGSAKYDGMPRAAIATGFVDLVLPPREMAAELTRLSRHPLVRPPASPGKGEYPEVLEDRFNRIFLLLRSATGVDFSHYK